MVTASKPRARRNTAAECQRLEVENARQRERLEVMHAMLIAAKSATKGLLDHAIDDKAHAFPVQQEAMNVARACVVEIEQWLADERRRK